MDLLDVTRPAEGRIVYVVEDNLEIGRLVCATLDQHGFRSEHFSTGTSFLQCLRRKAPAISVIDLGLPDLDGLHLVRQVQAVSDSAILILTGRKGVDDRILGLELGADDYMVKPFEPREVVARVNTILRRLERKDVTLRTARFGDWTFEESCNRLTAAGGREVELSVAEARLLATMLKRPNRILNRTDLLDAGGREPLDRSIDARISRLRRKLQPEGEEDDKEEKIIKTVYGAGYMLVAKVEWE